MRHLIADLPEPYREALLRGRAPSFDERAGRSYRDEGQSSRDPRRQPWRYFALCSTTGWTEVLVAVFLTPISVGAAALVLRGAYDLLFDPSVSEKLGAYVEEGRWGMLGFSVVVALVLVLIVGSLLVFTFLAYEKLWHSAKNRRAVKAGLGHYGAYLSHDHLLLRRADDPRRALLVPREQVARIERFMLPPRGAHPTHVWRTELHVRRGDGLIAIAIHDHELAIGPGLEAELRAWLDHGLAPRPDAGPRRVVASA